ncbi:hypothetical protein, partial [Xanthomonas phaseoli]|uniref:hypothetical protein n=1 Tax=Xanthomonas phaseoli TaxID=1985254 RepID=UPI001ADA83FC
MNLPRSALKRIDPFLISDSDLRIKSCKELSECRWFTEVMFGSAKGDTPRVPETLKTLVARSAVQLYMGQVAS